MGGAAGAGCGIFTLVGLLVGVGLTVWLGSQVLGGGGSSSGAGGAGGARSALDDLQHASVPGTVPAGQRITVTTDGTLVDGDSVRVGGTGLAPGPLQLTTCLAHEQRLPEGLAGCDPDTTVEASAGDDGTLVADYQAHRVITVGDVGYDCAAFDGACVVVAHPAGHPDQGPEAGLTFAPGRPPVDAERPPGG